MSAALTGRACPLLLTTLRRPLRSWPAQPCFIAANITRINDTRSDAGSILVRYTHSSAPSSENVLASKPARKTYYHWQPEEDKLLLTLIEMYGKKWQTIASKLPGRSPISAHSRARILLSTGVNHGRWTPEEDKLLQEMVDRHPIGRWTRIAADMPGRTAPQCRQRWCYTQEMRNAVKGVWSEEETHQLCEMIVAYGYNWIRVADGLKGRTTYQCRDRWNTMQHRFATQYQKALNDNDITTLDRLNRSDFSRAAAAAKANRHKYEQSARAQQYQTSDIEWTRKEDVRLMGVIDALPSDPSSQQTLDWKQCAEQMQHRTAEQCHLRYQCLMANGCSYSQLKAYEEADQLYQQRYTEQQPKYKIAALPEGANTEQDAEAPSPDEQNSDGTTMDDAPKADASTANDTDPASKTASSEPTTFYKHSPNMIEVDDHAVAIHWMLKRSFN